MAARTHQAPQGNGHSSGSSGRGFASIDDQLERLSEPIIVAVLVMLVVGALLPLAVVAFPVWYAVWLLQRRQWPPWRWRAILAGLCCVPALLGLAGAWFLFRSDPVDQLLRYLDVQINAATGLWNAWQRGDVGAWDWRGYGLAIAPYALAGGLMLGVLLCYVLPALKQWGFGFGAKEENPNERTPFLVVGADEHARLVVPPERVLVQQFLAARRVTVLASWPKQGKSYAVGGLLAAGRDGGMWFGRRVTRLRSLWLTEESREGFKDTIDAYGLTTSQVSAVHAQEVRGDGWFGPENWEAQVAHVCGLARRMGADTLVIDSLFTWASWYQRGPDAASACFRTLRQAAERYKLAILVIAHNTKAGDPDAPVLALLGTIAAAALVDQIGSFRRDKETGHCTLTVEGRKLDGEEGEWQCTAVLKDGRYVPVTQTVGVPRSPAAASIATPGTPLPRAARETLEALQVAGPLTAPQLRQRLGISKATASERLTKLLQMGLVTRTTGTGTGPAPLWAAVEPEAPVPPEGVPA